MNPLQYFEYAKKAWDAIKKQQESEKDKVDIRKYDWTKPGTAAQQWAADLKKQQLVKPVEDKVKSQLGAVWIVIAVLFAMQMRGR